MVNSKFLKKIMVVGEKSVLQQLTKYVDMATVSASYLKEMFSLEDEKKAGINEKIKQIEKDADELSMSMRQQITGGAISSNLMDDLITLVETCDDLLDKCYFISREVKRIHENSHKFDDQSRKVMRKGYDICSRMADYTIDALKDVKIVLDSRDSKTMIDARVRIEVIEEKVDDLKDNLIDELYNEADTLPYIIFIHLTELVHKMDDLLDDCEDISDLVHTIDVSITR
ncbi:MAG: DUF47 family protein [Candidatus Thermoplasmatota archaeon]|nr:DUF47 family protein [Candidatus Thermoplasmatota archaeon]